MKAVLFQGLMLMAVSACLWAQPSPTGPSVATPKDSESPSQNTIQGAQQRLQALGYQPGSADGIIGAKTVLALKKFQADHKLPITGALDARTVDALKARSVPLPGGQTAELTKEPGLDHAGALAQETKSPVDSLETDWSHALQNGDPDSFREFLQKHPTSSNVQIVEVTIPNLFTFLQSESWSPQDLAEASKDTDTNGGAWGFDIKSATISIYPLTIRRAAALGHKLKVESRNADGRLVAAVPPDAPMTVKVLCAKDGQRYRIVDVEK
jgi:hypothetical protein